MKSYNLCFKLDLVCWLVSLNEPKTSLIFELAMRLSRAWLVR
jgi:hypothetical protein